MNQEVRVPFVASSGEDGNDSPALFPDILQDEDKFYLPVLLSTHSPMSTLLIIIC